MFQTTNLWNPSSICQVSGVAGVYRGFTLLGGLQQHQVFWTKAFAHGATCLNCVQKALRSSDGDLGRKPKRDLGDIFWTFAIICLWEPLVLRFFKSSFTCDLPWSAELSAALGDCSQPLTPNKFRLSWRSQPSLHRPRFAWHLSSFQFQIPSPRLSSSSLHPHALPRWIPPPYPPSPGENAGGIPRSTGASGTARTEPPVRTGSGYGRPGDVRSRRMPAAGGRPTSKCPGENGENGWELMGSRNPKT